MSSLVSAAFVISCILGLILLTSMIHVRLLHGSCPWARAPHAHPFVSSFFSYFRYPPRSQEEDSSVSGQPCSMTYMRPSYSGPLKLRAARDDSRTNRKALASYPYEVYAYRDYSEGQGAKTRLRGAALFIPGHAGSYEQVRSIGSNYWDVQWFTMQLNEEWAGMSGHLIRRQKEFIAKHVVPDLVTPSTVYKAAGIEKSRWPSDDTTVPLFLFGHSYGGLIAHLVANEVPKHVRFVITLAAPMRGPPHGPLDRIMAQMHREARRTKQFGVPVLALDGGECDEATPPTSSGHSGVYGKVPQGDRWESNGATWHASTTRWPHMWLSTDHAALVWCNEIVRELAAMMSAGMQDVKRLAPPSLVHPQAVTNASVATVGDTAVPILANGEGLRVEAKMRSRSFRLEGSTVLVMFLTGVHPDAAGIEMQSESLRATWAAVPPPYPQKGAPAGYALAATINDGDIAQITIPAVHDGSTVCDMSSVSARDLPQPHANPVLEMFVAMLDPSGLFAKMRRNGHALLTTNQSYTELRIPMWSLAVLPISLVGTPSDNCRAPPLWYITRAGRGSMEMSDLTKDFGGTAWVPNSHGAITITGSPSMLFKGDLIHDVATLKVVAPRGCKLNVEARSRWLLSIGEAGVSRMAIIMGLVVAFAVNGKELGIARGAAVVGLALNFANEPLPTLCEVFVLYTGPTAVIIWQGAITNARNGVLVTVIALMYSGGILAHLRAFYEDYCVHNMLQAAMIRSVHVELVWESLRICASFAICMVAQRSLPKRWFLGVTQSVIAFSTTVGTPYWSATLGLGYLISTYSWQHYS
ncbi:post-GPI attachment to proteins 1 [Pycnococcus provasolii]|uniref:GPI inositol-deacylase n=1 Tax=Pycnococcus provasolii TaxID=41880 RepID=A0A830HUP7_9CHLO|nr:post-GPI attachment to proteins 1 [Pycnococcus provasolii]